jgi:predicted AAA+ superfamily ATPase
MAKSNRQRVDETLLLVADGLGAFAEDQLRQHWGDNWLAEVQANSRDAKFAQHAGDLKDPDYVLWLASNQWRPVFYKVLSETDRAAVSFLRDTRNAWAHNNKSFSLDETHRVIDMAHMLLSDCAAVEQAADLDEQRQEVLRLKFEEQTKRQAAKSAESLAVQGAVGGLRPWREVVEPHDDVASGTYQLAEFAADLRQVHAGTARAEYGDPVEFFRRTYLTRGLRTLLVQTMRRMNGTGGDPVVDLMTTFGGGKTHSLLAVYHLVGGTPPAELAGMAELAKEIGVPGVPIGVKRAVIVGNDFSPRGSLKEDGTQVNTMWGELAWQLGGRDAYDKVRGDDVSRTNPGTTVLADLLAAHAPCIVLIDEWIAYARQLWNRDDLPGGGFEAHMTFAQSLTEAAKAVPDCLLVVSIPASDSVRQMDDEHSHEIGGVGGVEALKRLRSVVHRTDSPWQPASADESFEIVRRRLFKNIPTDRLAQRDVTCRRFADMYAKHPADFPAEVRAHDYEQRLKAAYPIHPDLFDRLYQDWSTLERFQRTRGVLRLMAIVVQALWARNDASPMILPASVPIEDTDVFEEITSHLDDHWKPVVDRDVAGPGSLPALIDKENTNLGRSQAAQRVARAIFIGTAPMANRRNVQGGDSVPSRGIETVRISLGSAFPDDTPAVFGDALRRLNEQAAFLNNEGARYWYSTQRTVSELARGNADNYSDDEILDDLATWVRSENDKGDFARVHRFPQASGDVDDEQSAALVILGASYAHGRNTESAGKQGALEFVRQRGGRARQYQNTLLFLVPDSNRLPDLLKAVRMHKSWSEVQANRASYNLDQHNIRLAESNISQWADTIRSRLSETYIWMLVPRQDPGGEVEIEALKMNGQGTLAQRAAKKAVDNDLLISRYSPALLRMVLDAIPLWRDDRHVGVAQLWEDFTRYLYLPRLKTGDVLLAAVEDGPQQLNVGEDGFGYADAYDETSGRYRGLVLHDSATNRAMTGLVVRYEIAAAQHEADKQASAAEGTGAGASGDGGATGSADESGGDSGGGKTAATAKLTRFVAFKDIDPVRAGRDAGAIADEILAHFVDRGSTVRVTIEIAADDPEGFDDAVQRVVTENANTLGFGHHEFQ